jgi:hypothetical protein
MTSRIFALGAVAALAAISAVSAVGPQRPQLFRVNMPGTSHLHAFGSRGARQTATGAKFDAALADITRHLNLVRPDHTLADLHSLNLAARFMQPAGGAPMVLIDAVTRGDAQQLKTALVGLGLQHASVYSNDVGGWLPVAQLDAATALSELNAIRAAMPRTRTGSVTSQGDFVQHSDLVRSANALTGAGVTVGVLSDSFDCYAVYATNGVPASGNEGYAYNGFTATATTDVSTGDLPSNVNVLEEAEAGNGGCLNYGAPTQLPFSDEGRAMLQVVYDVAPGASLAFYTAENSEADFANGIVKLAAPIASGGAGATVIADDIGYFDEPFFQDGIVAQAVDQVQAQGVAYFSAAGNDGTLAYDNNAPVFTAAGSGPTAGETLLNFDTTNTTNTTTLPVTIPPLAPGEFAAIVLEWDQSYLTGCTPLNGSVCGAANQLNLCVTDVTGNDVITDDEGNAETCTGPNTLNQDPVQILIVGNNANGPDMTTQETFNIVVGLASGAKPGRIKVAVEGDGIPLTINQFWTPSPTIQGHPGAAGAMAIGAAFFLQTPACGTTPATLEYYSSPGGDPILFNVNGARLAAPVIRQKPDFVGPDGGNDTFLGFTLASANPPITDNSTIEGCQNNAKFPNFFGTSAATPHIASIAALFLQANPTLTLAQLYDALSQTALPIGAAPNYSAGWGFVQADAAAAKVPAVIPAAPTLTLGASSIVMGSSTTLTWSSANNQGCMASGTWMGAQASSGTQNVTPTAVGSYPYSLACTNNAGTSPMASVMLTVTAAAPAPSGGGGGGGALGLAALLGLCAMCLARARRSPRLRGTA